jgi:hypothetical protein
MVNIPSPQKYATTDDVGQPVIPFAAPQRLVAMKEMAVFGMPHNKGCTEEKGEHVGAPTETTAPYHGGHKRGKTTTSKMADLAP